MTKGLVLVLTMLLFKNLAQAGECLPARVEKDFPERLANGAFMRFSPTGDFAIVLGQDSSAEGTGRTYLVDLRGATPKVISTQLAAEAYPVEGDWDVLGSPSMTGTTYFELKELLKESFFTKSAFKADVGGLYHVSGTLPAKNGVGKVVRTVSYDRLEFADTEIEIKDGKVLSAKQVVRSSKYLCGNFGKNGKGPELMQVMLSKDGTELVGIPASVSGGNLKLYKVQENLSCSVEDIPIASQKPMFSHPQPGKKGYIAFHTGAEIGVQPVPFGQVSIYDRDLKKYLRASLPEDKVVSFSPGTLKDGRVAFIRSAGRNQAKLVIVDPYQMNPGFGCLEKNPGSQQNQPGAVQ